MDKIKIAACQMPEIREDINGALAWMTCYVANAQTQGVRLVCFPECCLQGYLVNGEEEMTRGRRAALDLDSAEFAAVLRCLAVYRPMLVFGLIEAEGDVFFNTAVVVHRGRLVGKYRKNKLLGGETLFDPGTCFPIFDIDGLRFGINICYDTAHAETAAAVAVQGADLILCPANNMSPYAKAKKMASVHNPARGQRAKETGLWLLSADITGERDGRIAHGPTALLDPDGRVVDQLPLGGPGMLVVEIPLSN
jgi:predicted amidohydrolase